MNSVLLIEDDPQLSDVISAFLELSGFSVRTVYNACTFWSVLPTLKVDLIILDLGLPDEDGLVLLRKLQSAGNQIPIIVCSGRNTDSDRIAGLELGASDYLPKPFSVKELVLRIKRLIKSSNNELTANKILQLGDKRLNLEYKNFTDINDNEITLTAHELSVLSLLAINSPRIYSREEIIDSTRLAQGPESIRAVDTVVSRLRKKIEVDPKKPTVLKTITGLGYKVMLN